tara:strand:+ start:332 stop:595 length:264 start_codon:yes stop_codon:yes gene_type:complete
MQIKFKQTNSIFKRKKLTSKYHGYKSIIKLLTKKNPVGLHHIDEWLVYGDIDITKRRNTVGYVIRPFWFYMKLLPIDIIKHVIRFLI